MAGEAFWHDGSGQPKKVFHDATRPVGEWVARYEYKTVPVHAASEAEDLCCAMGSMGWKLIQSFVTNGFTSHLIFERQTRGI